MKSLFLPNNMNIKTAFFLAFSSIKRGNKGTIAMTILIMTLAYINLVFISSIFGGIVKAMEQQSIDNLYGNIVIETAIQKQYIDNSEAIENIQYISGIEGVSPHYINRGILSYDALKNGRDVNSGQWTIKSITPEKEKKVSDIYKYIIDGEYLEEDDRDKIIVGKDIAGGYGGNLDHLSLKATIGDKIDVQFSNGVTRTYTIKGVFKTKSSTADQMAFISNKEMESVLQVHNWAHEIIVTTNEIGDEASYIPQIQSLGLENEEYKTWQELMGVTADVSKSFDMISLILGAIGTLVAGITIFIIIFVSVVNKRRQIGILKAIGMQDNAIILYFVLQAIFYGIIGIILGIGIFLFVIAPFFITHPLDFPMGWVSLDIKMSTIVIANISLLSSSIIGGFFPAQRGAKEDILSAMWG